MYFIPFASLFFIGVAEADGNLSWYAALPTWLFIYYKLLIGFSWYLSASIVITAVFSLIRIHFVLRDIDEKNIDVYNADNNCGFFACNKLIIIFLGISLYYLFAGGMMFLADFNAFQYGVEHTFYLYPWTGFIFLIMFFLYLVVVLIPMIECISKVGKKIDEEKEKLKADSEEYKNLMKVKIFPLTIETISAFFSVWVVPLLMLVVTLYT